MWHTADNDPGDVDDGWWKRRTHCVNDRVRWTFRNDNGEIVRVLIGTVVAIMTPTAIDANDVWVRWDGRARPQVFTSHHATWNLEVL
jgi:hypothetical protein